MLDVAPDLTQRERVHALLDEVEEAMGELPLRDAVAYVAGRNGLTAKQIEKVHGLLRDRVNGRINQ